jgi:anti-anti-sigma regulatory factor
MEVKIDTKEKFTVVTPIIAVLPDNIAAEWVETCKAQLLKAVKNTILNLEKVTEISLPAANMLMEMQQVFYEQNASFVICGLQSSVEDALENMELLEMLNVTPTESEAWDIVQMEEIERELLDSDDFSFDNN